MMSWKHVWENHICLFYSSAKYVHPPSTKKCSKRRRFQGKNMLLLLPSFIWLGLYTPVIPCLGPFPDALTDLLLQDQLGECWWHQPPFYQNDQMPYHRPFSKPLCMGAGRKNMKESVLKKATKQTCSFPSSLKEEPVPFPCPKVFWWWWEPGWLIFSTWRVEGFLCTCCPWCACGRAGGRSELRGSTSRCSRALPAARPWGHQSLQCAQDMVRTCARLPPGDGTSLPFLSYISPPCLGQGGK